MRRLHLQMLLSYLAFGNFSEVGDDLFPLESKYKFQITPFRTSKGGVMLNLWACGQGHSLCGSEPSGGGPDVGWSAACMSVLVAMVSLRPTVFTRVFSRGKGLGHTGGALPKELGISPGARKSSQCTNRLEDNFVFPNSELIKISLGTCLQTRRNNKRIHHLEFYL